MQKPSHVNIKWKAIVTLIVVFIAIITDKYWIWGLILVPWAIMDLINKQTWLTEVVTRQDNPVTYFAIVVSWLVLGFYLLLLPFSHLLR